MGMWRNQCTLSSCPASTNTIVCSTNHSTNYSTNSSTNDSTNEWFCKRELWVATNTTQHSAHDHHTVCGMCYWICGNPRKTMDLLNFGDSSNFTIFVDLPVEMRSTNWKCVSAIFLIFFRKILLIAWSHTQLQSPGAYLWNRAISLWTLRSSTNAADFVPQIIIPQIMGVISLWSSEKYPTWFLWQKRTRAKILKSRGMPAAWRRMVFGPKSTAPPEKSYF